jgi:hypothetical protein
MPKRALVLIDVQAVVPAGQVHTAFVAALGFGYARLVSTEEYLAGGPGE